MGLFSLRKPLARASVALFAAASLSAVSGSARGHGAFPASTAIVFDPTTPGHLVVRTTFGIFENFNGGAAPVKAGTPGNWRWICSQAAGYQADTDEPAIAYAGGTLLVGTFGGLFAAKDEGLCDFELVGAELGERFFVDLAGLPSTAAPAKDSPVLALSSNYQAADTFEVRLFESKDGGASWQSFGSPLPPDFLAVALEAAPKPGTSVEWGRIYLSGYDGKAAEGHHNVVLRSDDAGASWKRFELPQIDPTNRLAYLQAVDPSDPDVVYLAGVLDEPPLREQVNFRSKDGGASWAAYFEAAELLPGLALAPDGQSIAVGGEKSGLWLIDAASLDKVQVNDVRVGCLTWQSEGLYACGNQYVDDFSVGLSKDLGKTFEPVMFVTSACGPVDCDPDSTVAKECAPRWTKEAKELIAPASCYPEPDGDEDGCSFVSVEPAASGWRQLILLSLTLALILARRSRRGRRSRAPASVCPTRRPRTDV